VSVGGAAGELAVTRVLRAIAARGGPAADLAMALETLRTVGVGAALRRRRQERELRRLGRAGVRDARYLPVWRQAADELGAEVEALGGGFFRIHRGRASTVVLRQTVALDDYVTLRLSENKETVLELLAREGLPIPEHVVFDAGDLEPAASFVESHARCVVKPADGTGGGAGVTGGVATRADLERGALKASRWSRRLLAEDQAQGLVYRLLLLEGELLDVVRRRPPQASGDGRSTILEHIEKENEQRLATRSLVGSLLRPDLDMVLALRAAGCSLTTVLPRGRTVSLKNVTSQNSAADNETYGGPVAPELVAEARRAAEVVGVRLAGIDVVTPDPSRPLREAGGVIIEVNGHPGLTHHYDVADSSRATPVAIPILRRLLEDGGGSS
jgi:hypothetical protein